MAPKLRLKFDANQEHQLRAVESVALLFEGMPRYWEITAGVLPATP